MRWTLKASRLFVVLGYLLFQFTLCSGNPCSQYRELGDKRRRTTYGLVNINRPFDDSILTPNWYRFVGEAGDRMASGDKTSNGRVPVNHCGTVYPVFISGAHPTSSSTSVKVCGNLGSGCDWSSTIQVQHCGNFFVYYLRDLPDDRMAYCGFKELTCGIGSVKTPNGQSCMVDKPTISTPTIEKPELTTDRKSFNIHCSVTVATSLSRLYGLVDVNFYFNGILGYTRTRLSLSNGIVKGRLPGRELRGRLPCSVSCGIVAYWRHTPSILTPRMMNSNSNFFAGLQMYDGSGRIRNSAHVLRMKQGDQHPETFFIKSTLPITLNTNTPISGIGPTKQPKIKILLLTSVERRGHSGNTVAVGRHLCQVTISDGSWNATLHKADASGPFRYIAYKDGRDATASRIYQDTLRFQVKGEGAFSIWDSYNFPPIQVQTETSSPAVCLIHNDPYVYTFDAKRSPSHRYEIKERGEFLLARSTNNLFKSTVRTDRCEPDGTDYNGLSCVCGIALQEGDEILIITKCGQYRNKMTTLFWRGNNHNDFSASKFFAFAENVGGNSKVSQVSSKRGFTVKIVDEFLSGYGLNIELKAPEGYDNVMEGLCGDNDGSVQNDNNLLSGSGYLRFRKTTNSPFNLRSNINALQTFPHDNECFCYNSVLRCGINQVKDGLVLSTRAVAFGVILGRARGLGRRRRSANHTRLPDRLQYYEDDFDMTSTLPVKPENTFPTPNGITQVEATRLCRQALERSTIFNLCRQAGGFDVYGVVPDCVNDMRIADDRGIASLAIGIMESSCVYAVETRAPDKTSSVTVQNVTERYCSADCQENGRCEMGVCICNNGFAGSDCQINKSLPPRLVDYFTDAFCNANEKECKKINMRAENVYQSNSSTCLFKYFFVDAGSGRIGGRGLFKTKAELGAASSISCELPKLINGAMFLNVSVSLDAVVFSNEMPYLLYDSVCMDCKENSTSCTRQLGSCIIDQQCYDNGEVSQQNSRLVCKAAYSTRSWAVEPAQCGIPGGNISDISRSSRRLGNDASADVGMWPWHAQIFVDNSPVCSGALVHPYWVITDATCVDSFPRSQLHVVLDRTHTLAEVHTLGSRLSLLKLRQYSLLTPVCLGAASTQHCYTTGYFSPQEDCYDSSTKGEDYQGLLDINVQNRSCVPWNQTPVRVSGTISRCRNPRVFNRLLEEKPWCFTDKYWTRSLCTVPRCPNDTRTLQQSFMPIQRKELCESCTNNLITPDQICAGYRDIGVFKGEQGSPLVCQTSTSDPMKLWAVRTAINNRWAKHYFRVFNTLSQGDEAWIRSTIN